MSDLAAFILARLDEDEALARQAAQVAGPDWSFITEVPEGRGEPTDYVTSPNGALLLDTMGGIEGEAPHVARHDPARVLREVEAKRAIVDLAAKARQWTEGSAGATAGYATVIIKDTLRHLAAVYSGHPDYDLSWAPEKGD